MKNRSVIIVAISLLALLAYQLLGYYAVFEGLRYQAVQNIRSKIRTGIPENELHTFISVKNKPHNFYWFEENELRSNGEMYDVVKHTTCRDTTFYYCVKDAEEEKLLAGFSKNIWQNINQTQQQQKTQTIVNYFWQQYISAEVFSLLYFTDPQLINKHFLSKPYMEPSHFMASPPPEFS